MSRAEDVARQDRAAASPLRGTNGCSFVFGDSEGIAGLAAKAWGTREVRTLRLPVANRAARCLVANRAARCLVALALGRCSIVGTALPLSRLIERASEAQPRRAFGARRRPWGGGRRRARRLATTARAR